MPIYAHLSDDELSQLLLSGDAAAYTEVFNRYWDKLFIHALRMLRNEEEASDVVQELFTSLWTKVQAEEIQIQSNLSAYLYVMTRNRVLNCIRQKKTRNNFEDKLAVFMDSHQYTVLDRISEAELAMALEREIGRLPARMQEVFKLSRKEHLSYKQIGDILEISDLTVKKQISNAIKILKVKIGIFTGFITTFYLSFFS